MSPRTRSLGDGRVLLAIAVAGAILVEGIASIRIGFAPFESRQAVLTLVTGVLVGGAGLVAWIRSPKSRAGTLLIAAAGAWFIGGFRWAGSPLIAGLGAQLDLLFAAILVHTILTFPGGHILDRRTGIFVIAAYGGALLRPPLGNVLAAAILVAAIAVRAASRGAAVGRGRRLVDLSGIVFAATLFASVAVPRVVPGGGAADVRLGMEIGMVLVAMVIASVLVGAEAARSRVTDLVLELESTRRRDLARELGDAVGDPSLRVAYWLADQRRFVDQSGATVQLPDSSSGLTTTSVERGGEQVAMLIHDRSIATDAGLQSAIGRAAELSATNARLQAEVLQRIEVIEASTRRLLEAGDRERLELDRRLRVSLEPRLDEIVARIDGYRASEPSEPNVAKAQRQLEEVRSELAVIADGLHPRALEERGLAAALQDLADRCPVPVTLEVDPTVRATLATETGLFYVCSEALTNAVKHAEPTIVAIRIGRHDGRLVLDITDDGVGGADPGRGTGLRGLRDRVEAMGGRLQIESRPGSGTRLTATVPTAIAAP